jgi:hypothetical protein
VFLGEVVLLRGFVLGPLAVVLAFAGDQVPQIIIVGDGSATFFAVLGPGLAGFEVGVIVIEGHIEFAVLAKLGHPRAGDGVLLENIGFEVLFTVLALG